jgi:hypothetical protein
MFGVLAPPGPLRGGGGGFQFWSYFRSQSLADFDTNNNPQNIPKMCLKHNQQLDNLLLNFGPLCDIQRKLKMSQDGVMKSSKRRKIAKTNGFDIMRFDIFLTLLFEHQASQESPKTIKKAPKMALRSFQEPLNKYVFLLNSFLPKLGL